MIASSWKLGMHGDHVVLAQGSPRSIATLPLTTLQLARVSGLVQAMRMGGDGTASTHWVLHWTDSKTKQDEPRDYAQVAILASKCTSSLINVYVGNFYSPKTLAEVPRHMQGVLWSVTVLHVSCAPPRARLRSPTRSC